MAIEQSWVAKLQQRLQQQDYQYQVVNASISGDTTIQALQRLPKILQKYQPDIVIIEIGGNDGLRGFPLRMIQKNLSQIIKLSQTQHSQIILLGIQMPPNYGRRYTEKFSQIYADLAQQFRLHFVPEFLNNVAINPDNMQADGIHPNASAQILLLDNVWQILQPLLSNNNLK